MTADTWWLWIAGGIILAILELLAPGAVFVGFSIGSVSVGLLLLTGISMGLPWLLLTFAIASGLGWIAVRQLLGTRAGQKKTIRHDINED